MNGSILPALVVGAAALPAAAAPVPLPAGVPGQWIELEVRDRAVLRYAIAPESLAVGGDGVVRYVVALPSGSARNVVFEGIRCGDARYTLYAYLAPDGRWRRYPGEGWHRVARGAGHRVVLYRRHFCDQRGRPRPRAEILRRLGAEAVRGAP
ncbi:CNP1-like family protein [Inmirania thermothiophila]|uniref:CNP1-like family protein n=1 Tax=Inmirania thermothiophila TaxID=1750597 RepID=A0A3N1XSW3_9GAMM|nr:CNP1-like family protein [Inmirania thermothiophila]ROR29730.1 CNP1-like family protein [Inmirania thermothiophila]